MGEQRDLVHLRVRDRKQRRLDVEHGDRNLPRIVAAVARVQARLVGDETDRVAGADGNSRRTHNVAGVGIESARDVQRQHLNVALVESCNQIVQVAANGTRQADAEQAIDHERPWFGQQSVRQRKVGKMRAALSGARQRLLRICGLAVLFGKQ